MWSKLLCLYEFKSESSIHLIQQQFYELRMSSDDIIETFIAKVEENAEMLKDLKEPISNKMIITKVLMSVPSGYNDFISAWESTPEQNRTLEDLTNRLILEQSRLNINNDATAFVSKKKSKITKEITW